MTPTTNLQLNPATDEFQGQELAEIRSALLRYRVMAWIVGVMLVILVCVGMPLKYLWHNDAVVTWTGMPHGWLYAVLLITVYDLGRRVRWPWSRMLMIALAGTVPFLTFVAEFFAARDVKRRLDAATMLRARPQ